MEHIQTFRLFQAARPQQDFPLDDWETEHLRECLECQHVREVFVRQFTALNIRRDSTDSVA